MRRCAPSKPSSARPSATRAGSRPASCHGTSGTRTAVPGAFLRRLWRDLYGDEPPGAPRPLLSPDLEFRELGTGELLATVPRAAESVLRRGRALMELGRRASGDPALLAEVAAMIRDPDNRRLATIGTVSVSQLGTAGLVVGGSGPAAALARELAAEWPTAEQADLAWLMTGAGVAWPGKV